MSEERKTIVISSERLNELAECAAALEEQDEIRSIVSAVGGLSPDTLDLLKQARVAFSGLSNDELIRRALEAYLHHSK